MKALMQVACVALATPAFGVDDNGGWEISECPSPIHVDRYTTRGGGGLGQSFADCGVTAKCDEVGASAWARSYLLSGHATHQDAANGWTYKAYRWTGEGNGEVRFLGRAHTNEGKIRAISGKASIALEVAVEIEDSVTPVIFAEGHGRVSNFGSGGSLGVNAQVPTGTGIPVTLSATAPRSTVSANPHEVTIPEMTDQKVGEGCMSTFDWQVRTHAASEVYADWNWFGGSGYARGSILAGENAEIELILGGSCQ